LAGPSTAGISNPTSASTPVTGLKDGEYYFKLTVDDGKDVDFDIVKVVSDSNTGLAEIANDGIQIYPNPVGENFCIKNIINEKVDVVQLFDMKGVLIKNLSLIGSTVSLSGILSGQYCIRILTKNKQYKSALIIKK
ncbi:MAG: T9SS type A sorting domain-containing protein, partial [Paludibacter sp.]